MRNPLSTERSNNIGLLLARLPLGVFFVIAGCNKLVGGGFRAFASSSKSLLPAWVPPEAGSIYLHALPFLEVAVGLMIVLGLFTRLAGLVCALVLTSIVIATNSVYANALPHPNLIFLGVASMLFFTGGGGISLDGLFFRKKG